MDTIHQPKTEKGQETLDRILEEAARLFSEKGYYKTAVKDITKAANVGIGTFYIYFEDKHSLYRTLLTHYGKFIRKHIANTISRAETRTEAERAGIQAYVELVREKPWIYNIIWEALYVDKELFKDYYDKFSASYVKQIKAAQAKGEIVADYDPETLAYFLMGITSFLGLRYAIFEKDSDLEPVMDTITKIFESGFLLPE